MALSARSGAQTAMKITFSLGLLLSCLVLASCTSNPVPPDWQVNSHGALNTAVAAYLKGNTRLADIEFARARNEIASTARLDLLARSTLVRCAARVASLEWDDCPEYQALATDAGPGERDYADFISGRWEGLQAEHLPQHYRALLSTPTAPSIAAIKDPLAQLVAAGALLRTGRIDPVIINIATDTASAQGWRRPLLAWLGVQAKSAEDGGNMAEAAQIRRRIALVTSQGGAN